MVFGTSSEPPGKGGSHLCVVAVAGHRETRQPRDSGAAARTSGGLRNVPRGCGSDPSSLGQGTQDQCPDADYQFGSPEGLMREILAGIRERGDALIQEWFGKAKTPREFQVHTTTRRVTGGPCVTQTYHGCRQIRRCALLGFDFFL